MKPATSYCLFTESPNTGYCCIIMFLRKRSCCSKNSRVTCAPKKTGVFSLHFNSTFGTTFCASQAIFTISLTIWWPLSDYCPKIFARSLTLQLLRVICHLEQSCKPHLTQQGQQSVLSPPPYFLSNFLGFCVSRENKTIIKKEILQHPFQRSVMHHKGVWAGTQYKKQAEVVGNSLFFYWLLSEVLLFFWSVDFLWLSQSNIIITVFF